METFISVIFLIVILWAVSIFIISKILDEECEKALKFEENNALWNKAWELGWYQRGERSEQENAAENHRHYLLGSQESIKAFHDHLQVCGNQNQYIIKEVTRNIKSVKSEIQVGKDSLIRHHMSKDEIRSRLIQLLVKELNKISLLAFEERALDDRPITLYSVKVDILEPKYEKESN